jgi:phenylacetate-CoA ligase
VKDRFAPLVRHLIAPLGARWERSPYLRTYRRLLQTQYDSPEAIRQRQLDRLRELVRHAFQTTAYWRERLAHAGAIETLEDYRRVPILTKADLRADPAALLSRAFARSELHRKTTSGSTGVALAVWVDEAAMQWKRACTLRADEWSGWRLGERAARLWGNPPVARGGWRARLRNLLLERSCYLDTLKLDATELERFTARLRRRPPSLLFGHAHSLYLLAEYLGQRGGAGFRPRGIISSAMVLHDWERARIEAVFGCPVTNRYGCEEVSLIACECEEHRGLHVNSDGVYVEVLRADGHPARPGEAGSVVVTDLVNRAMPLLRYQVGDVAVVSDRRCPCGRGLPLLERVEGREADYVLTPSGRLISGISLTENFAMHLPGVAQLQIVQEALDHFLFRIVRGPDYGPASAQRLGELVTERFGPDVTYRCEFLPRIPPEPSGKYRFCLSRVQKPFACLREVTVG